MSAVFAACEAITDSDENDACNDPVNELTECGRCQVWENEKRDRENEKREIEERQVIRRKWRHWLKCTGQNMPSWRKKTTSFGAKWSSSKESLGKEKKKPKRQQHQSSPNAASKVEAATKTKTATQPESATKPKAGGTSSGCSVTMSVTRIVSRFKYYVLKISLISFLFTKGQPMTHFFAYVLCSNQGDSSLNREFADLNSNHFKKFLSSV